ncbi:hypothetical protein [Streptomyces sp. NPDC015131]|uniref:hypothetical protein n=1 Tax=Streptomyces sp. NPDC015131 TaxID=3364941 RepID=UPI0036FDD9DB
MKKRSMLAVASLVAGAAIAAVSPAPSPARAAAPDGPSAGADVVGSVEDRAHEKEAEAGEPGSRA